MALDWGKQISFTGLRKRKPKPKEEYPSKTYMNLMPEDKRRVDLRRTVPIAIIVVVVAALAVKFGVLDFYDRLNQKQAELSTQSQVLSDLQTKLVDYEAVKAEYDLYESSKLVTDDLVVSAVEALDLVDKQIRPAATVNSINLQGNSLSLNLSDITLTKVGDLVSKLYEQEIVQNVSVSTASDRNDNRDTTAAVVITLQRA